MLQLWHVTGLLVYTGMRRNEIRMLSWENIDLKKETITVMGKGGKRRIIPIHPKLREILDNAPETGTPKAPAPPFGPKQGAVLWTQARGSATKPRGGHYADGRSFEQLKEAFAPDYQFHRFRKTVAIARGQRCAR
jgi:integrase